MSSDSSLYPGEFERLASLHDDNLAVDWLKDFHANYWGVRNGVQVTTDDGRTAVCIPNTFGLPQTKAILVRESYHKLWQWLHSIYLRHPMKVPRKTRATVVRDAGKQHPLESRDGKPAGRRLAVYYLLVAAAEARVPFVFHSARDGFAYVCLDAGAFFIPPEEVEWIYFTARVLVLMDPAEGVAPISSVWHAHGYVVTAGPRFLAKHRVLAAYGVLETQRNADRFELAEPDEAVDDSSILDDSAQTQTVSVVKALCLCEVCRRVSSGSLA